MRDGQLGFVDHMFLAAKIGEFSEFVGGRNSSQRLRTSWGTKRNFNSFEKLPTMSRRSHLPRWTYLLLVSLLGCTSGDAVEKDAGAIPNGLIVERKGANREDILVSETQEPLQFSYTLTNVSDAENEIRLVRTSCGCVAVNVTSATASKPLTRGSAFTLSAREHVTLTLDVRLLGKPIGLHTFPTELSVVRAGTEEPFPLPEPRVRILADISADPPVLSHQYRWDDNPVVEKCITITARRRAESGEPLPQPKLSPLPNYITLQELRKLESLQLDEYLTEKWTASFSLKRPHTEDYTVANAIRISFPGSPHHELTIPSTVTVKRGVETRPRSVIFTSEGASRHEKRCVLVTATDNRPFSITRITVQADKCRAKVGESKRSVSHLIEVTPVSITNPSAEDILIIETDHPDTPSLRVRLSKAG